MDDRLPSYQIQSSFLASSEFSILDALEKLSLSKSRSDTKRLIKSKGIKIKKKKKKKKYLYRKSNANNPKQKIYVGKRNIGIKKKKK